MVAIGDRIVGCQEPAFELVPSFARTLVDEALELGERCGLVADPWQRRVLTSMLALDELENFAAFKVGVNVPRQNGKGAILELRELAGIFLLGEQRITHSAQQLDTSLDHMERLANALEEGGLSDEVKAVRTTNGREAIIFRSGQRIRFRSRSRTGGRGLSGDLIVLDEAMFMAEYQHNVLIPMLTAQERPQVIYAGSAADQQVHEHAIVWARLREEALKGENRRLAYFEWSAGYRSPDEVPEQLDMEQVARANPALGIRITERYIEDEWGTLDQRGRSVERLGVGDWPATELGESTVIDMAAWGALEDAGSVMEDPVCLAFDVSPERRSSIAASGRRPDGQLHVDVVEAKTGTKWLPDRLAELVDEQRPYEVVCAANGPVASVIAAVEEAGVTVRTLSVEEHAAACGNLVDVIADGTLHHLAQPPLTAAMRGAATRPLGDAWLWSRKSSGTDISPLVAATLAVDAAAGLPSGELGVIF